MQKFTLKDIAKELAMAPKYVSQRAKELGYTDSSKLSSDEADQLSQYVMNNMKPETLKSSDKQSSNKEEKSKSAKKDNKSAKNLNQKDSLNQATNNNDPLQATDEELADSKTGTRNKETNDIVPLGSSAKQTMPVVATEIKKLAKSGLTIIHRPGEDTKASKQSNSTKTQTPSRAIGEADSTISNATKDTLEIKQEDIESAPTNNSSNDISSDNSNGPVEMESPKKIGEMPIPQGIELSQIKRPQISAIRVISRNEGATKEQKEPEKSTKSSAVQLLDNLKNVERKERKKKKEKPIPIKQHKQSTHIINMERGMGSSDEDDLDEIVMMDLYEDIKEDAQIEEDKVEKARVNDKVKINRYSPWVKEGSIARASKSRAKKGRANRSKDNDRVKSLVLPEEVRVYEFAEKAKLELGDVLGKLFLLGVKMLKNDFLDRDTIEILASEYRIDVAIQKNVQLMYDEEEIPSEDLIDRPPVVTIMGHVDHGKTSLLDYIRNSRIAGSEAGGITQHIGAYMVEKNGKWISFIDTPGHEAFAQMRSRGAQVTDIAIIVIAADDGVKQQSIEALNHAKNAGVQIIIAMNKMDKEGANPDRLKSECAELGFTPIDWGGEYEFIPISAKTGQGVDVLLETILLQAEILELKASQKARVKAIVLEGSQQVGKGSVATIIVQQGILEVGQSIVADTAYGKVRTLKDDTGKTITSLKPSGVAQITGLSEVPLAGALLQVVENDSIAREIANKRVAYLRQKQLSKSTKVTFDELTSMVAKGQVKSVPVILRADTQGSLEAIKSSLESLNNQEVEVNVISFGIGGITQSDLDLANASSNCVVLGFNVRPTSGIKNLAKDLGVTIKGYSIIYDLLDDMKALLNGMMSPIIEEEIIGFVSVRETFSVTKLGVIAGCFVLDGKVDRNLSVRVLRNGVVLWSGKIASLKRFKDDVREVNKGYECGIMLDGFNDISPQDEFEIFKEVEKQRAL